MFCKYKRKLYFTYLFVHGCPKAFILTDVEYENINCYHRVIITELTIVAHTISKTNLDECWTD